MLLKRVLNRCKERKAYILILTTFWLLIFLINDPLQADRDYNKYTEIFNNSGIGATPFLQEGVSISQSFTVSKNYLEEINVLTASLQNTPCSKVRITIFNNTDNIIYCEDQDTSMWEDNAYCSFRFPRQSNSLGKKYTILFEGINGTESDSSALWCTEGSPLLDSAIVDGEKQPYSILINVAYWDPSFETAYMICWGALIVLSYVVLLVIHATDEKTFLVFSILLGSLFIVLNPFCHIIDEVTHFLKSFCISKFDWLNDVVNGEIGVYVPDNFDEIIRTEFIDIKSFFIPELRQVSFSESTKFVVNPYVSSVIPLNHAVAAIGIFIGRILHLNAIGIVWAGRLANYVYYTVICYLAIKNARYYKSIFFIIATLPMTQWLAASYSTNPVLLSSALLFVSICLKYRFDDLVIHISKTDMGLLLITGVSIASVKYYVYTPILLVFFLIPRKCFVKKQYTAMIVSAITILLGLGLIQIYLLNRYPYIEDRNGNVDVMKQIFFIKDHIIYTIRNFVNYFVTSIDYHISNLFYNSAIPSVSTLLSTLTILSAILTPDKFNFKYKQERRNMFALFLFIAATVFLLTIVALYVGYTPVGSFGVSGLQTRYLMPVLFFIMASLASAFHIENQVQNYSQNISFMAELSILLCLAGELMRAWEG